jgi:hypothetical protein
MLPKRFTSLNGHASNLSGFLQGYAVLDREQNAPALAHPGTIPVSQVEPPMYGDGRPAPLPLPARIDGTPAQPGDVVAHRFPQAGGMMAVAAESPRSQRPRCVGGSTAMGTIRCYE